MSDPFALRHAPAHITPATGRVLAFDLADMDDQARASWLAVYELGARDGWARGYQAAEDDLAAIQRRAHDVVQALAKNSTYDALADRRGDHARAERQRAILHERGIA